MTDTSANPSNSASGSCDSGGGDPCGHIVRSVGDHNLVCRICLSLMICPVTLPCGHGLCLECFKRSVDLVNLLCPFCRLRISCWARKAKNDNQLIDWTKWNAIKQKFPELVAIKMSGNECMGEELEQQLLECQSFRRSLAPKGEIRKEFEELSQKETERLMAEEIASQIMIDQILAEDRRLEQLRAKTIEETANDEEIARELQMMDSNIKSLRNRSYMGQ